MQREIRTAIAEKEIQDITQLMKEAEAGYRPKKPKRDLAKEIRAKRKAANNGK